MESDDSYLSLLFNEQIFVDNPLQSKGSERIHDILVYATHSPESMFEDNLNKCFLRLKIDLKRIQKTDQIQSINTSIKTLIFSDLPMQIEGFPELKYVKQSNIIWMDSFPTITADSQLKVIFWDKFQDFFN